MKVVVIYESLTGNTRRAARLIAEELHRRSVAATVCPITKVDFGALAAADLVIVGSWVDGIFVVGQRPGRAGRLRTMPAMKGKRAVVFCTYAINPGRTLDKMTRVVSDLGAEVMGGLAIRRTDIEGGVATLVDSVLRLVPA